MKKTEKQPAKRPAKKLELVEHEYVAAMESLLRNDNFAVFIDALRQDRENCVLELSRFDVVESERKTMALVGTIGAYTDIIGRYDTAIAGIRQVKEDDIQAA